MAFVKGVSGNPAGRPKRTRKELDLIQACRKKAPEALEKLLELMDSDNDSIAIKACISILDRGYGRPREQADEVSTILRNLPKFFRGDK